MQKQDECKICVKLSRDCCHSYCLNDFVAAHATAHVTYVYTLMAHLT